MTDKPQPSDGEEPELRICFDCNHDELQHKWYPQSDEYDGEERWECRFRDCTCTVTWSEHDFKTVPELITAQTKAAQADLLQRFEKIIGEDDNQKAGGPLFKDARNKLRAEQRQLLNDLKKESM